MELLLLKNIIVVECFTVHGFPATLHSGVSPALPVHVEAALDLKRCAQNTSADWVRVYRTPLTKLWRVHPAQVTRNPTIAPD